MLERILTLLRKEFLSVFRDARMRLVIFGVPVLQTLLFGYAVSMDVRHVRLVIVDRDQTPASRELIARFTGSDYFDAVARLDDENVARQWIDSARAAAILQINSGYEDHLASGRTAPVQMILDGADSNTARLVLNYSAIIAATHNAALTFDTVRRTTGRDLSSGTIDLRSRAWFNENLESRNYFVPGIMAIMVFLICLMLTGMAVVREKETGTIEQILVTPIRPVEFILGKCAPFIVIGFADVFLVTAVGVFWFKIPIQGDMLVLLLGATLFLLSTLGIGLFISTVSHTQQQAMMSTFLVFFPAMLLSGFIYPIANMPEFVQWLTTLNPLRHFLIIVRGVFLKGVGVDVLWPQMAALLAIGCGVMSVAVLRFRKTL